MKTVVIFTLTSRIVTILLIWLLILSIRKARTIIIQNDWNIISPCLITGGIIIFVACVPYPLKMTAINTTLFIYDFILWIILKSYK